MGNVASTNIAETAINESVSTYNSDVSKCNLSQSQVFDLTGETCQGGNITVSNINVNQNAVLDAQCLSNANFSTAQSQKTLLKMAQMASAIGQNVDFNPGTVESNNLVETSIQLSETIDNVINQSCGFNSKQVEKLTLDACKGGSGGGNINVYNDNFGQVSNVISKCVFKAVANSSQYQDLTATFSQVAKSKKENALSLIILIILIIVGILVISGSIIAGKAVRYVVPIALILIFLSGCIYLILAWSQGWKPFKSKQKHTPDNRTTTFPSSWNNSTKLKVCILAANYLSGCGRQSSTLNGYTVSGWPDIRKMVFAKQTQNMSDESAAQWLLSTPDATQLGYQPKYSNPNRNCDCVCTDYCKNNLDNKNIQNDCKWDYCEVNGECPKLCKKSTAGVCPQYCNDSC